MKILVVAPHPDDETLGCGGTLLRLKEEGHSIAWLLVTSLPRAHPAYAQAARQIEKVKLAFGFDHFEWLELPTTKLDTIDQGEIVSRISEVFKKLEPEVVYLPYRGDIHSDHRVSFDAALACTKWFRYPSVKKVLVYEVLSETEFSMSSDDSGFRPNTFVDISRFIDKKKMIFALYESENGVFPFPRSTEAIGALSAFRGSSSGFHAAEAFMLLRERI